MSPENLETIFSALNEAGVRYLVVGGLAVLAHGHVRLTRDLDLVVGLDAANTARALTVFGELGYRPNVPVNLMDFADAEKRRRWREEKGMQVFQLVSDRLTDCPVDIFVEEPRDFDAMYEQRVAFDLGTSISVPVIGRADLLCLKREAGRPRDLLDIEELGRLEEENG